MKMCKTNYTKLSSKILARLDRHEINNRQAAELLFKLMKRCGISIKADLYNTVVAYRIAKTQGGVLRGCPHKFDMNKICAPIGDMAKDTYDRDLFAQIKEVIEPNEDDQNDDISEGDYDEFIGDAGILL